MPATVRDNHEVRMTRTGMLLLAGLLGLGATGCVEDIAAPPPPPKESEVMHYWHFNALAEGTLTTVPADVSVLTGAAISYPGTGAGYLDRVDPGSDLNAQPGIPAGFGLRPRNPANTRELIIVAPSTGYEKLVVSYAVQRSGSGAQEEEFSYSTNGGTSWVPVGPVLVISETWEVKTLDLRAVAAVDNAANLQFRIRFLGIGSDGSSGNNRLDNLVIEGVPLV